MSHKRSAPSPPPFGRGCPGRHSFSLGDPSGKAVRAAKKEGKTNPPLLHIMYAPPWRTHHIHRRAFPVPPGFRPASAPSSPKGDDEEKGLLNFVMGALRPLYHKILGKKIVFFLIFLGMMAQPPPGPFGGGGQGYHSAPLCGIIGINTTAAVKEGEPDGGAA